MAGKFNHHLFPTQKVVIKSADHLSETFFNHHLSIAMGPLPTPAYQMKIPLPSRVREVALSRRKGIMFVPELSALVRQGPMVIKRW